MVFITIVSFVVDFWYKNKYRREYMMKMYLFFLKALRGPNEFT